MPRLAALLLLAGLAVSMRAPLRAVPVPPADPVVRPLTPAECWLLFMPSPSKVQH